MTLTDLFLAELDREVPRSRKALEHVPEGKADWKPHARSMSLGYLAMLVAMMPDWIARIIDHDQLDVAPKDARVALTKTSDAHLQTSWRLLAGGTVVSEAPRYVVIGDTMNHLAHHRGQLTVYLRLNDEVVPSIYGPTADDKSF
jgi:hypothetical protein